MQSDLKKRHIATTNTTSCYASTFSGEGRLCCEKIEYFATLRYLSWDRLQWKVYSRGPQPLAHLELGH